MYSFSYFFARVSRLRYALTETPPSCTLVQKQNSPGFILDRYAIDSSPRHVA